MSPTIKGPDGKSRCAWCGDVPEFIPYHDTEWGFPVTDDRRLFEKVCLEGFQSGLSWRTILNKRETFREVFHDFDFHRIAKFTERDIKRLLGNPGIIRHRGKIEATINNAQRAIVLIKETGTLAAYFWRFEPKKSSAPQTLTTSHESIALSKDLKKRGWKFVGPTTAFAFMQAMGLINDHVTKCVVRKNVAEARAALKSPVTLWPGAKKDPLELRGSRDISMDVISVWSQRLRDTRSE